MGRGFDVCLARPEDAATCEECLESEFVACLVRQSGLVIAGVKPAAVFGFRPRASRCQDDMVSRAIDAYARRFAAEGVMMHLLGERGGAQMLVVWRPRLVAKLLESASNRDFLTRRALPATGADALMRALAERMIACYARHAEFPHEVGLVLGFPLEDVEGFIADGGRGSIARGRWRVYGDPRVARKRFERLERVERHVRRLYSEGVPMRELLRMAAA